MNTAMALVFLDEIWKPFDFFVISDDEQEENLRIAKLSASIERYRDDLLNAYLKDWEGRDYPRRLYVNDSLVFGEDQMFLEPMGFTLQIRELSVEKKQMLYNRIKEKLLQNEVLGARQQEKPVDYDILPGGSRENGGFWWALNGPLIIGVNTFNHAEAWELFKNMTFANYADNFPEYWSGHWSASDNIDSSLLPTEGLPDQAYIWSETPVYCAHAHAWPLYCYYKLTEEANTNE
jgi:cellobiose phosphorylase